MLGEDRGSARVQALDGLRGWAAFSIVLFHFTWESFGAIFPLFRSLPLAFLGNGGLAIAIFFILSGYVLTVRRWGRDDNPGLPKVLARRYLRLEIPILAAVLLVWALMELGLTATAPAAAIVHREDWLGSFVAFEPDLFGAVWFALLRVYLLNQTNSYGPLLWTMATEFWGSLFVLSLSQSPRLLRDSYSVLVLAILLLLRVYPIAACFPAGALIALLQRNGVIFRGEPTPLESFVASTGLIAALLAAAVSQMLTKDLLPIVVLCPIVFVCIVRSLPVRRVLEMPLSRWLGLVSFPLFLLQITVLTTLTSWSIIWLDSARLLTPWTALGVSLASIVASFLAAWAFLPIEEFTLRLVKWNGWSGRTAIVRP